MTQRTVDLPLAEGLLLKSLAVEEAKLKPGSGARIRFDWVASPCSPPEFKAVAYMDDAKPQMVVGAEKDSRPSLWDLGQVTPVYYTMYLDKTLTPGPHTLNVHLIVNGRPDVYHALAPVEITTP